MRTARKDFVTGYWIDGKIGAIAWSQQDGGLWKVWKGKETIGWVWNAGYLRSERKGKPYVAVDDWVDGIQPGNEFSRANTFMGAIGILNQEYMHQTYTQAVCEPVIEAIRSKL